MRLYKLFKLTFCFFFVLMGLFAQNTEGKLLFKDGSEKKGYVKLVGSKSVKFRENKKTKPVKYDFLSLEEATLINGGEPTTYVYLQVANGKYKVVRRLEEGKLTLYTLVTTSYGPQYVGGATNPGGFMGGNFYIIKNLYVKRKDQEVATHLGSNQIFSKNFKKGASNYFKDCPKLVNKIQSGDYKRKDINDIVAFYNRECHSPNN